MIIAEFHAENVLNLRAVSITPDPNDPAVILTGANGAGKTSILDAIELAIAGGKAFDNGKAKKVRPLRDGENHAEITIEFGEYVVTRTWDRKADGGVTEKLVVRGADGYPRTSPQSLLNGFWGKLTFDPLAFATMDGREQQKVLAAAVDLGFDPAQMAAERKAIEDSRRGIGQTRDQLAGQIAGFPKPPANLPAQPVSVADLVAELTAAQEKNRERAQIALDYERARVKVTDAESDVDLALRALDRARDLLEVAIAESTSAESAWRDSGEEVELAPINDRIASIGDTNQAVAVEANRQEAIARHEQAVADYAAKTQEIADLDAKRKKALEQADFGVDGFDFDEFGVTLNGVPVSAASTGQQIEALTALGFVLNPSLRVVRISRGESLDAAHMARVAEIAAQNEGQVWIEKVDESQTVGFVISEGTVVSTPESRA